eukprot:TRINITY_DN17900_c0_g1_i7.p1 TRINITY_DN17900_c0_g1~~TRINITY_DN17900_c0_g1_i7.p1  ORF type:complete len:813 (+),score=113.28 TRINITY_DN17900_c0_g1_i7:108-2546(+)
MLLPTSWIYVERLLLSCFLAVVATFLAAIGEVRPAAQASYATAAVTLSYFIGERVSYQYQRESVTYMSFSVVMLFLLSFVFVIYVSVAIFIDTRSTGLCATSIFFCIFVYCGSKIAVLNFLIERLRILRNTGLPRFKDKFWLVMMTMLLPFVGFFVNLMFSARYHIRDHRQCVVGITSEIIETITAYNFFSTMVLAFSFGVVLKRSAVDSRIKVPPGMSKIRICFAACVLVFGSSINIWSFRIHPYYKDYICLMNCSIDVTMAIIMSDYMSGLTASRVEQYSMVQRVTHRIALMELDGLEDLFECEHPTPTILSLRSIVAILRQYKSYVPASLLENIDDIINVPAPEASRQPPFGDVSVVFTDIMSSTQVWSELPNDMRDALKIHNRVLRRCIATHDGYEVKTIGDSFMVAFDTLHDAVSFGLMAQTELFEATWPDGLSRIAVCGSNSCWNGLRIRIGIMFGDADTETNDSMGTVDYFGSTVNIAARLEGACLPGGVALYSSKLVDIKDLVKATCPIVVDRGAIPLKGIKDVHAVSVLFPAQLAGRSDTYSDSQLEIDNPAACRLSFKSEASLGSGSLRSDMSMKVRKEKAPEIVFKKHASVTIGRLSLRPSESEFPYLNDTLGLVATCLIRTDGVTLGLIGNLMSFTWNVSRRVDSHVLNSMRFADMYSDYLKRSNKPLPQTAVALSTSPASSGSVRSGDQRFVTVFGDALSLSEVQVILNFKYDILCTYTSTLLVEGTLLRFLKNSDLIALEGRSVPVREIICYKVCTNGWSSYVESLDDINASAEPLLPEFDSTQKRVENELLQLPAYA